MLSFFSAHSKLFWVSDKRNSVNLLHFVCLVSGCHFCFATIYEFVHGCYQNKLAY